MTLVLDAGALIAYEHGDRTVHAFLERTSRTGRRRANDDRGGGPDMAQRGPPGRLALLLQGLLEVELTHDQARRVGTLLGSARRRGVVDGSIVDTAVDGDEILTTDPDDITALAAPSGKNLIVTRV